jgi:hypothetical protein
VTVFKIRIDFLYTLYHKKESKLQFTLWYIGANRLQNIFEGNFKCILVVIKLTSKD